MGPLYYAAYGRVSLEEQRKGISLEHQISSIHKWAQSQSIPFELAQYVDSDGRTRYTEFCEVHSGFDYDRPEINIIKDLAQSKIINSVIVFRTDRFARDEAVFMMLERFFANHKVCLFSVEEGEFTPGKISEYKASIQRSRIEDDANTIKNRMIQARYAYKKSGIPQSQGHPLYGYYKKGFRLDTQYIIDEDQAGIIRNIFRLYVENQYTGTQIAAHLNDNNIPSPGAHKKIKHQDISGKWIDKTVMRVLQNSAYIGQLIGNRHISIKGKITPRDESEQIIIPVPTIIDLDLWQRAQDRLISARHLWKEHRNKKRSYLLAGMARCSKCGYIMSGSSIKKSGEKIYFYYRCSGSSKRLFMKQNCHNQIQTKHLDSTVWEFVMEFLSKDNISHAYQQQKHQYQPLYNELQDRMEIVIQLIREKHEEQQRLNWIYQKKRCDPFYFDTEWTRLSREKSSLEDEQAKIINLLEQHGIADHQLDELAALCQEVCNTSVDVTSERKRYILEKLRVTITVEPFLHHGNKHIYEQRAILIEILGHATKVNVQLQK